MPRAPDTIFHLRGSGVSGLWCVSTGWIALKTCYLEYRLNYVQHHSVQKQSGIASPQDLGDARAEVERLQETVQEQQAVIEQQERDSEEYARAEV